jgi:hypothetical protein
MPGELAEVAEADKVQPRLTQCETDTSVLLIAYACIVSS